MFFPFYFSYCYSSYYFSDFSLDFDYFDSFVVFLDHLLHDQNHRVSYLVALVSSDVYRLELEQQQHAGFVSVLNSWLLYRCFHFWLLLPFPALLTFLICFCSLLFVAIFTSTCVFSILFSFPGAAALKSTLVPLGVVHYVFDLVGYCDAQNLDFAVHFALVVVDFGLSS